MSLTIVICCTAQCMTSVEKESRQRESSHCNDTPDKREERLAIEAPEAPSGDNGPSRVPAYRRHGMKLIRIRPPIADSKVRSIVVATLFET